jgi:Resolvase, N terminal domain
MAIYGYCRVSTVRQANEGESLDVQRRQIEGYAHLHGLTLDDVVVEEGVSGSIPVAERPAGGALVRQAGKRRHHHLPKARQIVPVRPRRASVVEDMRKRGVGLHLLDLGGDIRCMSTSPRVGRRSSATLAPQPRGEGCAEKMESNPMHLPMHQALRCRARSKRSGLRCRSPAVRGHSVCRMHGAGGGAPNGNRNALKHGNFTAETLALKRESTALARIARETLMAIG